jgi:predicted subunit of tRNA(5-methylaminomethyl-2-thiouridylate) methyltransferase
MNYGEQYEYDLQAKYEAEMAAQAQAQAQAEYEMEMRSMLLDNIKSIEEMIEQKQLEIEGLKEEIQRLENML